MAAQFVAAEATAEGTATATTVTTVVSAAASSPGTAAAAPCDRCTTAKDGRTLHLHEREDYTKHRPHVEGAIAQSATWRTVGSSFATAERPRTTPGSTCTAAVNLRNLLNMDLARHDGAWVLAT